MKILIATISSCGDVQLYLFPAQELLAAGHDIQLATNPTLGPLAEAHAVPFVPVSRAVDMGAEGARLLEKSFDICGSGWCASCSLGTPG